MMMTDVYNALETAIQSEIQVQEMYIRLAEEASDEDTHSLFRFLAECETMHHKFLEAEHKAFLAVHGNDSELPSRWLRRLNKELRDIEYGAPITDGSSDMDLTQCKLKLCITENIANMLEGTNEELLQKQIRYEQELAIAADIQKKLLPQELPESRDIQIAASNIMARSVGGDYYDFIVSQQEQLSLVVADCMGKGMSAALLMTTIRTLWRSLAIISSASPGKTLEMVNQAIYSDLKATEAFITIFSASYNPINSILEYSSAGHNPPIFCPALEQGCKELDIGNIPVGIFPESEFPNGQIRLREGDAVVIYTDGVVEAVDRDDALFSLERLIDLVEKNRDLDAEGIKNMILSEVDSHTGSSPQTDDITLVVLKNL